MPVYKNHAFIRFIRNRLREEHLAWRIMFREEWISLLVIVLGVVLIIFFTRPLPPWQVTLAVGQPGSTTEQIGKRYQEIFDQEGVTLNLVNTAGSRESIVEADDANTPINAGFLWAACSTCRYGSFTEARNTMVPMPLTIFVASRLPSVLKAAAPSSCSPAFLPCVALRFHQITPTCVA
jgi:hypothetical protein